MPDNCLTPMARRPSLPPRKGPAAMRKKVRPRMPKRGGTSNRCSSSCGGRTSAKMSADDKPADNALGTFWSVELTSLRGAARQRGGHSRHKMVAEDGFEPPTHGL